MKKIIATAALASIFLGACSTDIHPQHQTIAKSKVPFGKFQAVAMRPLAMERSEGDSGDRAAATRIDNELRSCLRGIFRDMKDLSGPSDAVSDRALVIEPSIVDMKKINTAERIFLGPLVGSSAMLLKVKFIDTAGHDVVAEPIFYAKANAWGGAFSFGATDNVMLTRIVNDACGYARNNY
jgi:hypothetical protein